MAGFSDLSGLAPGLFAAPGSVVTTGFSPGPGGVCGDALGCVFTFTAAPGCTTTVVGDVTVGVDAVGAGAVGAGAFGTGWGENSRGNA